VRKTKQNLGWPTEPPFLVPDEALRHMRHARDRGEQAERRWNDAVAAYREAFPDIAAELERSHRAELPPGWDADIPTFPADATGMATRVAGGKVLNAIAHRLPAISGGSADLDPSTKTA